MLGPWSAGVAAPAPAVTVAAPLVATTVVVVLGVGAITIAADGVAG